MRIGIRVTLIALAGAAEDAPLGTVGAGELTWGMAAPWNG